MSTIYGNNTYLPPSPVVPMFLTIASVTRSNPMIVTIVTPNAYVSGQKAYFSVPFDYGMYQLDQLTGQILAVDSSNLIFSVAIDSTKFDPFIIPSSGLKPATVSPAGSRNLYNIEQVPFKSLANIGN